MSVEDTVKGIGKMMQEENFVGVFQMMPESYQSDLNGVVSEFGNAMDADLWNSVLGIAKDVGYILTERKEVIQGLPFYAQMNQGGELDKQYDGIASMLNNIANSDALTIDSLKEGNVAKIIKLLGEGTMDAMTLIPEADFAQAKEGINMIANAKVEVVSEEGDTAKVKITTEDGELIELASEVIAGFVTKPAGICTACEPNIDATPTSCRRTSARPPITGRPA